MSGPCGTNGQVGKSWRCRFSTAQCNACGVQFLSHVCVRSLLGHENTLAWSAAERTGCNVVKQSFQYQGPLNSDVGVSVENRLKKGKDELRSGVSNTLGYTRSKASISSGF